MNNVWRRDNDSNFQHSHFLTATQFRIIASKTMRSCSTEALPPRLQLPVDTRHSLAPWDISRRFLHVLAASSAVPGPSPEPVPSHCILADPVHESLPASIASGPFPLPAPNRHDTALFDVDHLYSHRHHDANFPCALTQSFPASSRCHPILQTSLHNNRRLCHPSTHGISIFLVLFPGTISFVMTTPPAAITLQIKRNVSSPLAFGQQRNHRIISMMNLTLFLQQSCRQFIKVHRFLLLQIDNQISIGSRETVDDNSELDIRIQLHSNRRQFGHLLLYKTKVFIHTSFLHLRLKQFLEQHKLPIAPFPFIQLFQDIPSFLRGLAVDDVLLFRRRKTQSNHRQSLRRPLVPIRWSILLWFPLGDCIPQIPHQQRHPHRELPSPVVGATPQQIRRPVTLQLHLCRRRGCHRKSPAPVVVDVLSNFFTLMPG